MSQTMTDTLYDEFLTWAQRAGLMMLDAEHPARAAFTLVAQLMRADLPATRTPEAILAGLRADGILTVEPPSCEHVDYGYPHPGCAEFGPPDEFGCTSPATHRVSWPDFDGFNEFEASADLCARHAFDAMLLNFEAQPYGQGLAHVELVAS